MHTLLFVVLITLYCFFYLSKKKVLKQNIPQKYYNIILICLVLIVGLRGEGIDQDYTTYISEIKNTQTIFEPSFIFISFLIKALSLPIVSVFLIYSFIGIYIKFLAIRKFSCYVLFSLIVYFSNILLLHEFNQIRAGVASGFLLLSIGYLTVNKKKSALFIFLASIFHYSSISAIAILFFSYKNIKKEHVLFWFFLPIMGLLIHLFNIDFISFIPIEAIRTKLEMYKHLEESGLDGFSNVNLFNLHYLFKLSIYYIFLFRINQFKNLKLFNISFKIYGLSLFLFHALSSITPILGYRIHELFGVVEIFLIPYIFTLFKTKKQSIIILVCYYTLVTSANIFHKHLIIL